VSSSSGAIEPMPAKKKVVHRAAADPTAHAAWKAAAEQRAAFKTSGDSGFYQDSVTTATFLVEIDGEPVGRFTKAEGLEVEVEVVKYEEGGENGFEHKFPGRMSWPNLKLTRGITETDNLLAWLTYSSGDNFGSDKYPDNSTKKKNVLNRSTMAVVLVSATGERLRAWNFEGAFPVRWSGPSFASSADDLAEEELEIAHHGFKSVRP
jgi:phage tail-like protein